MPRDVQLAFGEVIRELRHERGLSQEELSFAAERHRTYVSLIERGKNSPSISTLWMMAEALQVRPSEIISQVERLLSKPRRYRAKSGPRA